MPPQDTKSQQKTQPPDRPTASRGSTAMWWIAIALAVGLLIAWLYRPPALDSRAAIGKPAPEITVVPLLGETLPPEELAAPSSTITLLHFWGTWCGPCRQEYPELVAMVQQLEAALDQSSPGETFRFVSVSSEAPVGSHTFESLQAATQQYYDQLNVEVATYCDPYGRSRKAAAAVLERPALYYPTTILIGPDGRIVQAWEGYTPEGVELMRERIEQLL